MKVVKDGVLNLAWMILFTFERAENMMGKCKNSELKKLKKNIVQKQAFASKNLFISFIIWFPILLSVLYIYVPDKIWLATDEKGHLCKMLSRISLHSLHRLIRNNTFHFYVIFSVLSKSA